MLAGTPTVLQFILVLSLGGRLGVSRYTDCTGLTWSSVWVAGWVLAGTPTALQFILVLSLGGRLGVSRYTDCTAGYLGPQFGWPVGC